MRRVLAVASLVALYALTAPSAGAASISGITFNNLTGGVWGNGNPPDPDCPNVLEPYCPGQTFNDDSTGSLANGSNEWQSNGTTSAGATTFNSRFFNSLASQSPANADATALHYDADHSITLGVSASGPWSLYLNLSRVAQLVVQDGPGCCLGTGTGSISVSALSTTIAGAALQSGSLALGSASQGSDGGSASLDNYGIFNLSQTSSAVLSGTGNASVTLTLRFDIDTYTAGQAFGEGDAICYRGGHDFFGNTDCSSGSTSAQGVFLSGTLVPEPGTALLLASGLAGLARSGRRRHPSA